MLRKDIAEWDRCYRQIISGTGDVDELPKRLRTAANNVRKRSDSMLALVKNGPDSCQARAKELREAVRVLDQELSLASPQELAGVRIAQLNRLSKAAEALERSLMDNTSGFRSSIVQHMCSGLGLYFA